MIRSLTEVQKGRIFYLITLGLAMLVALFGPTGTDAIQTLNMLTVTAGVLLMLLVVTPDGYHRAGWAQLGLQHAGFRYWPLALLAPTAVLVASYGAATLLGVVSWRFESDTAINLAIKIVIISFFAFFEEIGWRGYMLPKLATGYPRLAPALVGFLHGVWHLPLMLLTTAYNPARQPADRGAALPRGAHCCRNLLRVSAQRIRQPLARGDRARHLQRGPRRYWPAQQWSTTRTPPRTSPARLACSPFSRSSS